MKDSATALEGLKGKPLGEVLSGYVKQAAAAAPPASPKDYGIGLPQSLVEIAKDPAVAQSLNAELGRILAEAHADGMSRAQAAARVEREAKKFASELEAEKKAAKAATDELKAAWKDKYDERVALTARAIDKLPDRLKKVVEDANLRNQPEFIEMIYFIGEAQREGSLIQGDPGASRIPTSKVLYGP